MQANKLKAKIMEKGLTQKALAQQIGICDKTFYSKMEKGNWGIEEVADIVKILGLSKEEMLAIFFADE